jgi:hypothetical protein
MAWDSTDMSEGSYSLTQLRIRGLVTRIVGKKEALLIEKGCMERCTVGSRNWVPLSIRVSIYIYLPPKSKEQFVMESYRSIDLLVLWPNWFLWFSQVMQASAFLRCHGADLYYGTDAVIVCPRV